MRRLMLLVFAVAMAVVLLAACGQKEETTPAQQSQEADSKQAEMMDSTRMDAAPAEPTPIDSAMTDTTGGM